MIANLWTHFFQSCFNVTNIVSVGVTRAVDLCAAPGSWSQVLVKKLRYVPRSKNRNHNVSNSVSRTQKFIASTQSLMDVGGDRNKSLCKLPVL